MDNRKEEKRGKGPPIVLKALHIKLKMSLTSLDHSTFVLIVSVGNARIQSRLDMIYPDLTKLQTIFTEENFVRIQRNKDRKDKRLYICPIY
jgi:hypothetical protein